MVRGGVPRRSEVEALWRRAEELMGQGAVLCRLHDLGKGQLGSSQVEGVARGAVLELPGADGNAHMPASPYVIDGVRSDAALSAR